MSAPEATEKITRMMLVTWASLGWDHFQVARALDAVGIHEATIKRLVSDFKVIRASLGIG